MLIMELAAYLLQLNGKQGMTKPIPIVLLSSGCSAVRMIGIEVGNFNFRKKWIWCNSLCSLSLR
jgi:hypothetical protein